MRQVLFLVLGGSLGTLARYFVSQSVQSKWGTLFPWGTLMVNITGSFLIGFVFILLEESFIHRDLRAFISIGFLGAYTTFSTFSLETLNLFREGDVVAGAGNMLMTNVLGIVFTILGLFVGKLLLRSVRG